MPVVVPAFAYTVPNTNAETSIRKLTNLYHHVAIGRPASQAETHTCGSA